MHFVFVTTKNNLSKERPQAAKKGQAIVGNDNTGIFDDRVFSVMSAILAHEALPPPLTARERAIEAEQTDHDIIYGADYDIHADAFDIEIPHQDYTFDY